MIKTRHIIRCTTCRRCWFVPFIVNLSIATCLSGFSRQLAKQSQLHENCFTCFEDYIFDGEVRLTPSVLLSIINSAGYCNAPVGFQALLLFFSLQFAFRDSTTNRYSCIYLHFPCRIFFYSSSLLSFLPHLHEKFFQTLRFIFIRSSYLSKYNYMPSAQILAIL